MRIVIDASSLMGAEPRTREYFREVLRNLLLRGRDHTYRLCGWPRGLDCADFLSPLPRNSAAWSVEREEDSALPALPLDGIVFSPIGIPTRSHRRQAGTGCPRVGTYLGPAMPQRPEAAPESPWFVTLTRASQRRLSERGGVAVGRVRWIPPGSGLSSDWKTHASACPVPSVPYVVTASAGAGVGDFQRILAGFRHSARNHRGRLKLLVLGHPRPVLPRLARWSHRGTDVEFLGDLSREDRLRVLASARAFVVPRGGDQVWFSLQEALHAAIPVIVPRDDSLVELLGDAALHYSAEDPGGLASQIWRCLEDNLVSRTLAKRAVSRARVFSWETHTLRLLDLFTEVHSEHVRQRGQEPLTPWRDWRLPA